MTYDEHLLTCCSEECVEIAQAIDKSLRFGLKGHHPDSLDTNEIQILKEYYQLQAVMEILFDDDGILTTPTNSFIDIVKSEKKAALSHYVEVAIRCGTISDMTVPGETFENEEVHLNIDEEI